MRKRVRLGLLTPSSNTALEPLTCRMLAGLPEVTAHFSRFKVTEIALSPNALAQFDDSKILDAASLLADAKVDVIGWSGTSAGWLGFASDELLCRRILDHTGVPATTSVLALNELLHKTGRKSFGLVTPYTDDVQRRIVANYEASGFHCTAERHLGITTNFAFADVGETTLVTLIRDIAHLSQTRPQAIVTLCTNLWAAHLVNDLEEEIGIPIYDSVATVVWKALELAGAGADRPKGWGSLFDEH